MFESKTFFKKSFCRQRLKKKKNFGWTLQKFFFCKTNFVLLSKFASVANASSVFILFVTWYILHTTYHISHISHIIYYILHTTYYILHTTYYILHTAYYILHTTYDILHIIYHQGTFPSKMKVKVEKKKQIEVKL